MKSIIKQSVLILTLSTLFAGIATAQKQIKAPFVISANSILKDSRVHGKLTGINDTALVISDKKDSVHYLPINKLGLIRIEKNRSDVGFGVITGVFVAGSIVAAATIDEPFTAILVGAGGAVGAVTIMSIVHGIAHPPVLKLREKEGPFTRAMLVEKLTPYIAK